MKVYVHQKGIILSGKAWEIREQLKLYAEKYQYVHEWVKVCHP